ncbi:hypothetical protein HY388_00260 [Candidatus Daviesbacteria bacterium]|nr:hypothetical protein [Candidatus Daviesbacteria bacterium]
MNSKEIPGITSPAAMDLSTPHGQAQARLDQLVEVVVEGLVKRCVWVAPGEEPDPTVPVVLQVVGEEDQSKRRWKKSGPTDHHQQRLPAAKTPDGTSNLAAWTNKRHLKPNGRKKGPGRYR